MDSGQQKELEQILKEIRKARAFSLKAMARGRLVVDENAKYLGGPLEGLGFKVDIPDMGTEDKDIKKSLYSKVLVTRNTKDFVFDAPVYEYSIISLDLLKFYDPSSDPFANKIAQMISKAWVKFALGSQRKSFILALRENGKHTLEYLD